MKKNADEELREAKEELIRLTKDPEMQELYEQRIKALKDEITLIEDGYERGRKDGIKARRRKGRKNRNCKR